MSVPEYPGCSLRCKSDGSICGDYGECSFVSVFNNLISRRCSSINKRCQYYDHLEPISKETVRRLIENSVQHGLACCYCGERMQLTTSRDNFRMAISIDHKVPISDKGTNDISNLQVCCTRCNLVKGTMKEKHFVFFIDMLIQHFGREEMLEWLEDAFKHAQAYKIQRNQVEEVSKP